MAANAPLPATREALADHLDALGVRDGTFHLYGAHVHDAIVMDHRPDGWVVFYAERGGEFSLAQHSTESAACADLLRRVIKSEHSFFQLVAGPAPVADAEAAFDEWLAERGCRRSDLASSDWKFDDVPWVAGPRWRRFFVKILAIRRIDQPH